MIGVKEMVRKPLQIRNFDGFLRTLSDKKCLAERAVKIPRDLME